MEIEHDKLSRNKIEQDTLLLLTCFGQADNIRLHGATHHTSSTGICCQKSCRQRKKGPDCKRALLWEETCMTGAAEKTCKPACAHRTIPVQKRLSLLEEDVDKVFQYRVAALGAWFLYTPILIQVPDFVAEPSNLITLSELTLESKKMTEVHRQIHTLMLFVLMHTSVHAQSSAHRRIASFQRPKHQSKRTKAHPQTCAPVCEQFRKDGIHAHTCEPVHIHTYIRVFFRYIWICI